MDTITITIQYYYYYPYIVAITIITITILITIIYRDNGKENGSYYIIIGCIIYRAYIGIMEKNMETTG